MVTNQPLLLLVNYRNNRVVVVVVVLGVCLPVCLSVSVCVCVCLSVCVCIVGRGCAVGVVFCLTKPPNPTTPNPPIPPTCVYLLRYTNVVVVARCFVFDSWKRGISSSSSSSSSSSQREIDRERERHIVVLPRMNHENGLLQQQLVCLYMCVLVRLVVITWTNGAWFIIPSPSFHVNERTPFNASYRLPWMLFGFIDWMDCRCCKISRGASTKNVKHVSFHVGRKHTKTKIR